MFGEFKEVMTKEFEMTDIGLMAYYLGIEVNQREDGSFISQAGYAREILKKFRMDNSKSINTPVECGVKLSKHDEEEKVDPTFFICSDWHLLCMLSTVFHLVDAFNRFSLVDALDLVMAGRRNNNNGEMGGQNNQFLEGLTALLHEQNRIHGEQIQQILQAREQGSTPRRSAPSTQPVYKQFRELGPTEFKGTTDPIAAEGWIRSLETIFDFMQLTDADRIRCAIFMLRDDARVWWEGARLTVDLATLTWTDFKEVFYGKYFTVDNRTRLAREFLELRQGDLSVAEYVRRFERGRYFVPMITSQPVEELKHFTEGLRPAIRHDVRLSRVTTFREAVDQALMSERDRNDMIKEAQNKRLSYQGQDQQEPGKKKTIPGQNSGKQPFKQAQPRQQIQKTQAVEGTGFRVENKVRCSKCEKIHAGQCLTGTDACFMCKKSGHFARECPLLREPTKGRVFAMTQEQVDLDTAIITGMIYVANIPAHALIDSGATHSFISEAYLTKLGIIPERMVAGYSVLLPSGEELHSNRMVKNWEWKPKRGESWKGFGLIVSLVDVLMGFPLEMLRLAPLVDFSFDGVRISPHVLLEVLGGVSVMTSSMGLCVTCLSKCEDVSPDTAEGLRTE
ncbi:hypothetical protein ZIOFF_061006 [Zingiber officinale]|uniref:CCHC-type domain-containing protein n=2 Tax=Zingiber officinale TaxID=94328 RepID=A0A8J5FBL3_ZINOF|nr:hypothetical protein ZIOFF_061006 [Zingiber officinale]